MASGLGLISASSSSFDYSYLYDGLGTVVGLTESNGKLVERYDYDAWGQSLQSVPKNRIGTENKFRFAGEALNPGTGLYYLRARYYDPELGRFISKDDPLTGFAPLPISNNRYIYAENNPTKFVDPSGKNAVEPGAGTNVPGHSLATIAWEEEQGIEDEGLSLPLQLILDCLTGSAECLHSPLDFLLHSKDTKDCLSGNPWACEALLEFPKNVYDSGKEIGQVLGASIWGPLPKGTPFPKNQIFLSTGPIAGVPFVPTQVNLTVVQNPN